MEAKKRISNVCLAIIVIMVLGIGCAPAKPPEKLEPCEIKLVEVYPLFQGEESIVYNAVFSITNPNLIDVTVDRFEYSISVADTKIAAIQLSDDFYTPAGETDGK